MCDQTTVIDGSNGQIDISTDNGASATSGGPHDTDLRRAQPVDPDATNDDPQPVE